MTSGDSTQKEKNVMDKIEITQPEYEQIVALTKRSAITLVGCINLLKNSAISDMDKNQRIEFENRMKELTTADMMTEINLLLEDKNKGISVMFYPVCSAENVPVAYSEKLWIVQKYRHFCF